MFHDANQRKNPTWLGLATNMSNVQNANLNGQQETYVTVGREGECKQQEAVFEEISKKEVYVWFDLKLSNYKVK